MKREEELRTIEASALWDVVIIGGGATGLGAAVDAATRGFKTLLLEQYDFTKGTSSRSTKLVHGGVRYLAQGNIALVLEALRERGILKKNAPHLVKDQRFIVPAFRWWEKPFYTIGLTIYDLLAGKLAFGRSRPCTKTLILKKIPTLTDCKLRGGIIYHDGQFDDARMGINLAQTARDHGASVVNYMKVTALIKKERRVAGVTAVDGESGREYTIESKTVLNATGVFVDDILRFDNPRNKAMVRPSQGVHLVIDKKFVPGNHAIMIPKTSDGRILFAIPWHDRVVVGTTDVPKEKVEIEPRALEEEVDFILETISRFLVKAPTRADVKSVFAGLRPLAAPTTTSRKTKEISRGHKIIVSPSGLVTIVGGKWTTYRQMAEDAVDRLIKTGGLPTRNCATRNLRIHGYIANVRSDSNLSFYGADEEAIAQMTINTPSLAEVLTHTLGITKAQVVWAVREEMARTVEDILVRRTRALMLDARESIKITRVVAQIMAAEMGKDKEWIEGQVKSYKELAEGYILH